MDSDLKADDSSQSKDGMNLQREVGGSQSRGEFLELIFAHLTDAIFVVEPDGRIIDANPAACSMLGHSSDEPPGAGPYGFLTNVFGEEHARADSRTKRGTTVTVQRAYRRGDRRKRDYGFATSAIWMSGGRSPCRLVSRSNGTRTAARPQ
jgi:PAS domain S-box-containing protein